MANDIGHRFPKDEGKRGIQPLGKFRHGKLDFWLDPRCPQSPAESLELFTHRRGELVMDHRAELLNSSPGDLLNLRELTDGFTKAALS